MFNFDLGKAMAQTVTRHNSEEAKAKRIAEAQEDEALAKKFYEAIEAKYNQIQVTGEHLIGIKKLDDNGKKVNFLITVGTDYKMILWAQGVNCKRAYTSAPITLGYLGQAMSAQLYQIKSWRKLISREIKYL